MKILLTTLNSKYVHSNLALKYLYTVVADEFSDVEIREFTINNDPSYIYTELVRANYDMVCFSCYIWNIEQIKALCSDLKKARPQMYLCLGGPEVSYDGPAFAVNNPWADFLICGEGEYPFYRLCHILEQKDKDLADARDKSFHSNKSGDFSTIPGLIYRENGKIYVNSQIEPVDFNVIPFPYSIIDCSSDQVVYYESTRGCPFRCTYCLSSIDKSLRPLQMDRVKADLGYFLYKKVMQVKFIDRTFNYSIERAYEIFKYLIENDNGVTNFHFELCGDLMNKATLELLAKARKGLFQFEIGIQSANPETLAAINRKENVYPLLYNVEQLVKLGNIHIHVDLIAGLPYESYQIFGRSFNKVYGLKADALQLGFLKVLKGTPICDEIEKHKIVSRDKAPYEVVSTAYIRADELSRLHMIENMLDIYYNRGGFSHILDYLIEGMGKGAFEFYEALADFYYETGYQHRNRKKEDQYRILRQFIAKLAEGDGLGNKEPEDWEREAERLLNLDLEETFQPEECKRFYKKGWAITI